MISIKYQILISETTITFFLVVISTLNLVKENSPLLIIYIVYIINIQKIYPRIDFFQTKPPDHSRMLNQQKLAYMISIHEQLQSYLPKNRHSIITDKDYKDFDNKPEELQLELKKMGSLVKNIEIFQNKKTFALTIVIRNRQSGNTGRTDRSTHLC